jgi:peptidyl-prolyl cis-trans isomerase D
VISTAFGSDVGVDSDALQLPNNGLLWYDVTGITPSRERTLEEVKDQVATRWRDDEIAARLLAKADDMLGKLKAGTALSQVASEVGLKLESASGLQRGKSAGFVPAKVVDAVFKVAKGAPGSAEGETQTQRFVFRVTELIDPSLDANSAEAKQLSTSLQSSYNDDMLGQYIARLENDYGVSINQSALNQVISGGPINTGDAGDN